MIQKLAAIWKKSEVKWLAGWFFILFCGVGLVYYWRVAYSFSAISPLLATLLVCGGFSVLYLLVFATAHFLRQNFPLKAAILIFVAGLAFVFANPPLQAPDETMHFLRAYSIGSGNLYFDMQEDYPADVDILVQDFPGNYNLEMPLTQTTSIADAFRRYAAHLEENDGSAPNATTLVQQAIPYLPQAAGIAAGRLLGLDALWCMYLGRITNLACYAFLCYWAIRCASRWRSPLTALCFVPIGLFMAASTSSDGLLLGLQWLFVGICLSERLDVKKAVVLSLAFGLLFNAKYNYLSLLPLLLLPELQNVKLGKKRSFTGWRAIGLIVAGCIAAAVGFYLIQTFHNTFFNNYYGLQYADPGIRPGDQLKFILSNPVRYLAVFLYSVYLNKGELFSIGVFGWRDMIVPFVSYFAPLVLMLSAAFEAREAAFRTEKEGFLFLVHAGLSYAFTYTGMYLTSTPYTFVQITGVQTRYLLSAFFAGLCLISIFCGRTMQLQYTQRTRPQKTPPEWRMAHIAFVFAVGSALLLFQSYYIGA